MNNSDRLAQRRKLTDKQAAVLAYVTQEEAPTAEQIRVHFRLAGGSSVCAYIRALIRKGYLPASWKAARPKRKRAKPTEARAESGPVHPRTLGGLLPCPFCGHAAKIILPISGLPFGVWCSNKECSIMLFGADEETKTQVIAKWNRRA